MVSEHPVSSSETDPPVAVVEGPKGKAEIYERWERGRLDGYEVRFNGASTMFRNLGESYIAAGDAVGTRT